MIPVHRVDTTPAELLETTTRDLTSNNMKIRHIATICLCCAALLSSCGGGKPVLSDTQKAVVAALSEDFEGEMDFQFDTFEKIDSTAMGTEVDRRIEAFTQVLLQNYRLYNGYVAANKNKNAAKKQKSIELDTEMLKLLQEYKQELGADTLKVAYYDYKFSGKGVENGVTHIYKETYAAITPEGEVVAVSSSLKNLHTATGKVIPGYSALLAGIPDDEEVEE